ncbi:MAG: chemotaxis protein CheD [Deltaproteobacteria bacterium]|nr:chemotaxis protein CheD [Deltaproteobacteria bacterium]
MYYKQIKELKAENFVSTGRIATGSKRGLLTSSPLGSCVAVVAYDVTTKIGGLAHVMLPGKSPKGNNNKYAENAITNLINELKNLGASKTNIEICLVGGANVLRKKNDSIADYLINSIFEILKKKKLNVIASSLGGYERRTATLHLSSGVVNFTIGDSVEKKLYQFTSVRLRVP